jgi:hypothetical protein
MKAEAEIRGQDGAVTARRVLLDASGDCDALARATGVWASLVLESEAPPAGDPPKSAESAADVAPSGAAGAAGTGGGAGSSGGGMGATGAAANGAIGAADASPVAAWPAPADAEKPLAEQDWYLHHDEERTLEIGVGALLIGGATETTMAGASPYVVFETGHGLFLRPSLAVAQSVMPLASPGESRATWATARFDTCLRLPGMYMRHRGIQLDTCAGGDLGFTHLGGAPEGTAGAPVNVVTLPFVSLGPSLELRGELGGSLSAAVRGVAGVNLVRAGFYDGAGNLVDPPLFSGRAEIALSWRVR